MPLKWVWKKKPSGRYKARLVACEAVGRSPMPGIDKYSPTISTDSVRLFSSSGNLKPPDLTGSSMRNRLVPLQMVLRTRSELTSRHEVESERSPASSAAIQTLLLYA